MTISTIAQQLRNAGFYVREFEPKSRYENEARYAADFIHPITGFMGQIQIESLEGGFLGDKRVPGLWLKLNHSYRTAFWIKESEIPAFLATLQNAAPKS